MNKLEEKITKFKSEEIVQRVKINAMQASLNMIKQIEKPFSEGNAVMPIPHYENLAPRPVPTSSLFHCWTIRKAENKCPFGCKYNCVLCKCYSSELTLRR